MAAITTPDSAGEPRNQGDKARSSSRAHVERWLLGALAIDFYVWPMSIRRWELLTHLNEERRPRLGATPGNCYRSNPPRSSLPTEPYEYCKGRACRH